MTIGAPGSAPARVSFSFFSRTVVEFADPRRRFSLTREDMARIAPNTSTAPIFRTVTDADLTAAIYNRVPVLVNEAQGPVGNPWCLRLRRMFDKSNASKSGDLKSVKEIESASNYREWLSVHEGEYGHQFDHRYATWDGH